MKQKTTGAIENLGNYMLKILGISYLNPVK